MPLPLAKSKRSSSKDFGSNMPLGRGFRPHPRPRGLSLIQFDPAPSTMRFTAMRIGSSTCGELDSE
jgi:hypothetical protein